MDSWVRVVDVTLFKYFLREFNVSWLRFILRCDQHLLRAEESESKKIIHLIVEHFNELEPGFFPASVNNWSEIRKYLMANYDEDSKYLKFFYSIPKLKSNITDTHLSFYERIQTALSNLEYQLDISRLTDNEKSFYWSMGQLNAFASFLRGISDIARDEVCSTDALSVTDVFDYICNHLHMEHNLCHPEIANLANQSSNNNTLSLNGSDYENLEEKIPTKELICSSKNNGSPDHLSFKADEGEPEKSFGNDECKVECRICLEILCNCGTIIHKGNCRIPRSYDRRYAKNKRFGRLYKFPLFYKRVSKTFQFSKIRCPSRKKTPVYRLSLPDEMVRQGQCQPIVGSSGTICSLYSDSPLWSDFLYCRESIYRSSFRKVQLCKSTDKGILVRRTLDNVTLFFGFRFRNPRKLFDSYD